MYIIGDIQGGDSICGRHIHYGITAKRISRMCNAGPKLYSKPEVGLCERIMMQDVMNKVKQNNTTYLNQLYQAPHWIAWFDLDYGGNPEGIFTAACPPKALHALKNGIFLHILKEFFQEVIPKKACGLLDNHIYRWNLLPIQRYMRSNHIEGYPRLLFTSGIS